MTEDNKELLRLAAKAASIEIKSFEFGSPLLSISLGCPSFWNPLSNCNDAFRLAVKLKLDVCFGNDDGPAAWVEYFVNGSERKRSSVVLHGDDAYAATRLAIVYAAAKIGEAMP